MSLDMPPVPLETHDHPGLQIDPTPQIDSALQINPVLQIDPALQGTTALEVDPSLLGAPNSSVRSPTSKKCLTSTPLNLRERYPGGRLKEIRPRSGYSPTRLASMRESERRRTSRYRTNKKNREIAAGYRDSSGALTDEGRKRERIKRKLEEERRAARVEAKRKNGEEGSAASASGLVSEQVAIAMGPEQETEVDKNQVRPKSERSPTDLALLRADRKRRLDRYRAKRRNHEIAVGYRDANGALTDKGKGLEKEKRSRLKEVKRRKEEEKTIMGRLAPEGDMGTGAEVMVVKDEGTPKLQSADNWSLQTEDNTTSRFSLM